MNFVVQVFLWCLVDTWYITKLSAFLSSMSHWFLS